MRRAGLRGATDFASVRRTRFRRGDETDTINGEKKDHQRAGLGMHGSKGVCEVSGGGCSITVHELPPCGLKGKQTRIHRRRWVGDADRTDSQL